MGSGISSNSRFVYTRCDQRKRALCVGNVEFKTYMILVLSRIIFIIKHIAVNNSEHRLGSISTQQMQKELQTTNFYNLFDFSRLAILKS